MKSRRKNSEKALDNYFCSSFSQFADTGRLWQTRSDTDTDANAFADTFDRSQAYCDANDYSETYNQSHTYADAG
jgi:hypothetical protein